MGCVAAGAGEGDREAVSPRAGEEGGVLTRDLEGIRMIVDRLRGRL